MWSRLGSRDSSFPIFSAFLRILFFFRQSMRREKERERDYRVANRRLSDFAAPGDFLREKGVDYTARGICRERDARLRYIKLSELCARARAVQLD